MHVPNPLGSYPLVLRSKDAVNPRNNELMYDYVSNDLYFVYEYTKQIKCYMINKKEKDLESFSYNFS